MSFRDDYFAYKQTEEYTRSVERAGAFAERQRAKERGRSSFGRICCRVPGALVYIGCISAVAALFAAAAVLDRATVWLSLSMEDADGDLTFLGRTAVVNSVRQRLALLQSHFIATARCGP